MDGRSLYEEDYFAWLRGQAAALRRLAQDRRDLPNDLDLDQIAEEMEDVGKSELHSTQSFIRNILIHILLVAFDVRSPARPRWRSEILTFHAGLRDFATRSMRQLIDIDELWIDAIGIADARLKEYVSELPRNLPEQCPTSFEELTSKKVDWNELIERVAGSASRASDGSP